MKKIIYVDMDGVITNYIKHANELNYSLDDAPHHLNFFYELEPIDGAIESIHQLEKDFNVYVLTAASWSNSISFSEKIEWVKKYLPELKKKVIFSFDKSLLVGDYLIDDRNANKQKYFKGDWIHFGNSKFPDWKSVLKYIYEKENPDN